MPLCFHHQVILFGLAALIRTYPCSGSKTHCCAVLLFHVKSQLQAHLPAFFHEIKNPRKCGLCFDHQVIPFGFEPKTYCLEGSCSIQLSYGTVLNAECRIKNAELTFILNSTFCILT